jgi:integrase
MAPQSQKPFFGAVNSATKPMVFPFGPCSSSQQPLLPPLPSHQTPTRSSPDIINITLTPIEDLVFYGPKKRGRGRPRKAGPSPIKKHKATRTPKKKKTPKKKRSPKANKKMAKEANSLFGRQASLQEVFEEDVDKDDPILEGLVDHDIFDSNNEAAGENASFSKPRLSMQQALSNLNHTVPDRPPRQEEVDFLKAFKDDLRLQQADNLDKAFAQGRDSFLLRVIKDSSQETYLSNKRRVINAGFTWDTNGLYNYFGSGRIARTVGNNSCLSTLSTYKLFYSISNGGKVLPADEENLLRMTLRARRQICPDFPRIVGAINRDRLRELHHFYAEEKLAGRLKANDFLELMDASTMMYACALRIFQLRALRPSSFVFCEKDPKVCHVTVPAKVTKHGKIVETKEVHPDFVETVREIIQRRKVNMDLFHDWKSSVSFDNLMKDYNHQAANRWNWPGALSFHGTHNFRHGAAQDAYREGETRLVMLRTGHVSAKCAEHYARTDLQRCREAKFNTLHLAAKQKAIQDHIKSAREFARKALCGALDPVAFAKLHPTSPFIHPDEESTAVLAEIKRLAHLNSLNLSHPTYVQSTPAQRRRQRASHQETEQQEPQYNWDLNDLRVVQLLVGPSLFAPFKVPTAAPIVSGMPLSTARQLVVSFIRKHQAEHNPPPHPLEASLALIADIKF